MSTPTHPLDGERPATWAGRGDLFLHLWAWCGILAGVEGSCAGFFVARKTPILCDSAEPSTSLATARDGRFALR